MQHERDAKNAKMKQEIQQLRALARQQAEKVVAEKEALNKRLEQAEQEKQWKQR
jgi:hypothetical protein